MLRRAPARLHLDASVLEEATLAILDAFGMARSSATTTPERDLAGTA